MPTRVQRSYTNNPRFLAEMAKELVTARALKATAATLLGLNTAALVSYLPEISMREEALFEKLEELIGFLEGLKEKGEREFAELGPD